MYFWCQLFQVMISFGGLLEECLPCLEVGRWLPPHENQPLILHLMRRPPPVAQEVEKSLLGKPVTNSKPQENSLKPLGNSVKRLSDDIKAALSSENLSR